MSERDYSWIGKAVEPRSWDKTELVEKVANLVWNSTTLQWDRAVQPSTQTQPISIAKPSTATPSNVSASASSVTLFTANTARLGATIWNDSTAILYVKFGTTAAATDCTVKMIADAYYEVPFNYTGRIDGIWASATGTARITELTA